MITNYQYKTSKWNMPFQLHRYLISWFWFFSALFQVSIRCTLGSDKVSPYINVVRHHPLVLLSSEHLFDTKETFSVVIERFWKLLVISCYREYSFILCQGRNIHIKHSLNIVLFLMKCFSQLCLICRLWPICCRWAAVWRTHTDAILDQYMYWRPRVENIYMKIYEKTEYLTNTL